jgi:hypothetical protein
MDDPSRSSTAPSAWNQHWITVWLPECIASCYVLLASLFFTSAALSTWWIEPAASCWCYDAVLSLTWVPVPSIWTWIRFIVPHQDCRLMTKESEFELWQDRNRFVLSMTPRPAVGSVSHISSGYWGGALPVWEADIFLSSNSIRMHALIPLFSWCA